MNTVLKNTLLVVIPSIICSTVTFIITKKVVENKCLAERESVINREIEEFKKEYAEKMSEEPKRIPISQLSKEQLEKVTRSYSQAKPVEPAPQEEDIADEIEDEDDNEETEESEDDDVELVEYEESDDIPFVISQEEYDNDMGYSKNSLLYYAHDKTLTNENDYVLNIEEIIGKDSVEHFGDMSGDPTIVYVRNKSLNADYEVQLVHGSYENFINNSIGASKKGEVRPIKGNKRNDS